MELTQEEKETVVRFVFGNLRLVCQFAETGSLTPEFFEKLAGLSIDVAVAVARNPNTPPELLKRLATEYKDPALGEAVAGNPVAPPEALRAVYERWPESWQIQAKLAGNKSLPHDLAWKLMCQGSVRGVLLKELLCELGANPGVAPEILEKLVNSNNYEVRMAVASNPSTPPHVLAALAFDGSWQVRHKVAANPNTPPEVLKKMFRSAMKKRGRRDWDNAETLIVNMLRNPSVPEEILLQASLDQDNYIKRWAAWALRERREEGGEEQCS